MSETQFDVDAAIDRVFEKGDIGGLADRWEDEGEYEDIADYTKVFQERTGLIVHETIEEPFGFVISFPEIPQRKFHFYAGVDQLHCKEL